MKIGEIHSCPELMDYIQEVGFLPLLDSGIRGYSAEDVVADGTGHYGSGRVPSSPRDAVCMASSLQARRAL